MKRPLACTSLVFVVVLFLLQFLELTGITLPVAGRADSIDMVCTYEQGDTIKVTGKVADYTIRTKNEQNTTELSLKNFQIQLSESDKLSQFQPLGNKRQSLLVYLQDDYAPAVGSYVMLSGEISYFNKASNPGEFNARRFYGGRDVLFSIRNASVEKVSNSGNGLLQALKKFRLKQEEYLETYLPDGNDAIMRAMLFGNRKEMDEETKELYQKNGIAHILAISGLHISLLGMSVYKILLHLPIPKGFVLSVSGMFLVLYCLMVGVSVSAFRALVMFSFFLISKWLKRSYDMITSMAFSAVIWLMMHPGYLYDCGFQLSYAAIIGMGVILPALTEITDLLKKRWLRRVISLFLPSLSVNLMTAPILIYHYHELSFFSIVLNLIVLPLMAPLLLCGIAMLFMANLFGGISVLPGTVCSFPVNFILWVYEMGCRILECFPIGRKNMPVMPLWQIILYYLLLLLMIVLKNKKRHIYQFIFPTLCIFLLVIPRKPDFAVWTLDVGQGDCNVIFTKEGNTFIIDCGSTSKYKAGERILIPFLKYHGIGSVDGIIVSHPDEDHMNGIVELMGLGEEENIEVKRIYIYEKGLQNEPEEWEELVKLAKEKGIPVTGMGQGDMLQTKTLQMECIYPLDGQNGLTGNAASLVLHMESGEFCGLFTGDLEYDGESRLRNAYSGRLNGSEKKECDLLKVAHHGSSTSTGSDFLQWINPGSAVISCGENNRYGHPHKEVLSRLQAEEIPYLITYENGAINWITDSPHP